MKNSLYYIILIVIVAMSIFVTYFISSLAYFSISGFHSSSMCANIINGSFNFEVLNQRFKDFILLSILVVICIFLSLYFLLKQKTKTYRITSIGFCSIILILILFNIYEGKKAGLQLLEQCSGKISITNPISERGYTCDNLSFKV